MVKRQVAIATAVVLVFVVASTAAEDGTSEKSREFFRFFVVNCSVSLPDRP